MNKPRIQVLQDMRWRYLKKLIKKARNEQKESKSLIYQEWIDEARKEIDLLEKEKAPKDIIDTYFYNCFLSGKEPKLEELKEQLGGEEK
jgi:hypothetical protein